MRLITRFVIELKHGIYPGLISEISETIINHKIILLQTTITPPHQLIANKFIHNILRNLSAGLIIPFYTSGFV